MKKQWITGMNFVVLAVILVSTVLLFAQVKDNKMMQMYVGVLLSVLYTTWGMIYHAMRGDLHPKVVVEYLLVSCIAVILITTIVWM
jgi:hypothetical protein